VALGNAHQNHEPVGIAHPTDTENFMCKCRLRQQKSNRIPIEILELASALKCVNKFKLFINSNVYNNTSLRGKKRAGTQPAPSRI